MADGEALFQIKVVSKLTGLTADTIRAWERRYEAVQPVRSDSGVRMYTSAHVSRLELLRRVVSRGHAIGRVSHLSDDQLRGLLEEDTGRRDRSTEGACLVRDLLAAGDLKGAQKLLDRMEAGAIGHPWLQEKVKHLRALTIRDMAMARKELHYSRVKMSSRLSSGEVVMRYADETEAVDMPAYFRMKSSEGTGRKN